VALGLNGNSSGVAGGGWQIADTDISALLRAKDGEYQAAVEEREQQIAGLRDAIMLVENARTGSEQRLQDVESQLRTALQELEALQSALEHQIKVNATAPAALGASGQQLVASFAPAPLRDDPNPILPPDVGFSKDDQNSVAIRVPQLEDELQRARALAEQWRLQATDKEAEAARLAAERSALAESLAAAQQEAQAAKALPKDAEHWQSRYRILHEEHERTHTGLEEASTRLEALERYILSVRADVEKVRTQRDQSLAKLSQAQRVLEDNGIAPAAPSLL
jgi:chromosome segregation ATPase